MNIIDLINKKRLKKALTNEEIKFIIERFMSGKIKDYQMSSLLMAICINGMNEKETIALTKAMLDNSEKLDLSSIKEIKVDKHSTGGVGDKTTLVIAPLVAACGVVVPKMSGKGLGHTGGTIDKLESIEGFNPNLSDEEFINQLKEIRVAITTTSSNLVPADKKIYALRDVTGTVSSLPLIASSVMSKKIATGADRIVLDIKIGKGAFIKTKAEAISLAKIMIKIGKYFNKETVAIISNMNYPLGYNIGNGLEVMEAIDILKGKGNKELRELCLVLASHMVSLGKGISLKEAETLVTNKLNNGEGYKKLIELIKYQDGNINTIALSNKIIPIKAPRAGYITDIDALKIGNISMNLGAGRQVKEDIIDHGVGIILTKVVGDYVKKDEVIANVHLGDKKIDLNALIDAFTISDHKKEKEPLIYKIIR